MCSLNKSKPFSSILVVNNKVAKIDAIPKKNNSNCIFTDAAHKRKDPKASPLPIVVTLKQHPKV